MGWTASVVGTKGQDVGEVSGEKRGKKVGQEMSKCNLNPTASYRFDRQHGWCARFRTCMKILLALP